MTDLPRSDESAPQLHEEKRLVGSLLSQYAETLGLFADEVDDDDFTHVLGNIEKDLTLSPAELANAEVIIRPKVSGDLDERRVRAGSDPGIWVQIVSGYKEININGWGGMREPGAPMDYHDSHGATKLDLAHSGRTDDILDETTYLNINVQLGGRPHSDSQILLDRARIELRTLRSQGMYINATTNDSVIISDRHNPERPQETGPARYAADRLKRQITPLLPLRKR